MKSVLGEGTVCEKMQREKREWSIGKLGGERMRVCACAHVLEVEV